MYGPKRVRGASFLKPQRHVEAPPGFAVVVELAEGRAAVVILHGHANARALVVAAPHPAEQRAEVRRVALLAARLHIHGGEWLAPGTGRVQIAPLDAGVEAPRVLVAGVAAHMEGVAGLTVETQLVPEPVIQAGR